MSQSRFFLRRGFTSDSESEQNPNTVIQPNTETKAQQTKSSEPIYFTSSGHIMVTAEVHDESALDHGDFQTIESRRDRKDRALAAKQAADRQRRLEQMSKTKRLEEKMKSFEATIKIVKELKNQKPSQDTQPFETTEAKKEEATLPESRVVATSASAGLATPALAEATTRPKRRRGVRGIHKKPVEAEESDKAEPIGSPAAVPAMPSEAATATSASKPQAPPHPPAPLNAPPEQPHLHAKAMKKAEHPRPAPLPPAQPPKGSSQAGTSQPKVETRAATSENVELPPPGLRNRPRKEHRETPEVPTRVGPVVAPPSLVHAAPIAPVAGPMDPAIVSIGRVFASVERRSIEIQTDPVRILPIDAAPKETRTAAAPAAWWMQQENAASGASGYPSNYYWGEGAGATGAGYHGGWPQYHHPAGYHMAYSHPHMMQQSPTQQHGYGRQ